LHGVLVGLVRFGCLFIATGLKASGLWVCLSFLGASLALWQVGH